jgi:hypothetical protein
MRKFYVDLSVMQSVKFGRRIKAVVAPSVTRSRNYAAWRRFKRNPNAYTGAHGVALTFKAKPKPIPVASTVRLTFNKGWFPDRQFAPHLYSGKDLLDILSGLRAGDMNLFAS